MKCFLSLVLSILSFSPLLADIAPNPIFIKGIYTVDECKIQMTSEYVLANLYNDSSIVECTFNLENFGDATKIQIGFPEMNFQYWSIGEYESSDRQHFKIYIDGKLLSEKDIQVPAEMDSIYQQYMASYYYDDEYARKRDSIYTVYGVKRRKYKTSYPPNTYYKTELAIKELNEWRETKPRRGSGLWRGFKEQKKKGNFPWYVWYVEFNKNERRQIKVVYSLPSGVAKGAHYRYFNYILETGSGWYKTIEKAEIELQLHDIEIETVEEIAPKDYLVDNKKKTIKWTFIDLEPTSQDDIYVRYFNVKERANAEKRKRQRERARKNQFLNPRNWFR